MQSVTSLGSRISTQRTDGEGMQAPYRIDTRRSEAPLHDDNPPTPPPTVGMSDHIYNKEREHSQPPRKWTEWIPPKGPVRWAYAALIVLLLVALVPAPVVLNRKLIEASKPLLTKPYEALKMPTDTSKIFKDYYNTSGTYKAFRGDDHRGNDIFATLEYTIEACLLACNKYNEFLGSGPKPCIAGTMNYNQEESVNGQRGANCFLKTKFGNDIDKTNPMALGFRLCPFGNCSFNGIG